MLFNNKKNVGVPNGLISR